MQAELQETQDERHYSELESTKKPNDQVSINITCTDSASL